MPNKKTRITITDVAKAANVSVSTVSRILNNRQGSIKISSDTRELVLAKAKELGYELNPFAKALRSNRTGLIGAVIRDIADPFPVKLAKSVRRVVNNNGLEMLIGNTEYNEETAEKQLNLMVNHLFDGLIIFTHSEQNLIDRLTSYSIPYVTITGGYSSVFEPKVLTNDNEGVALALNHLFDLGHRNIGYIGRQDISVKNRELYFRQIMNLNRYSINENFVESNATSMDHIAKYFELISHLDTRPTAILCANDVIAIKVMNIAHKCGYKVPEDVSIVGFDDIDQATETSPTLTTVQQPYDEIAEHAVSLLVNMINNPESEHPNSVVSLSPRLIIRESSGIRK